MFLTLLPSHPESRDHRHAPQRPGYDEVAVIEPKTLCMLGKHSANRATSLELIFLAYHKGSTVVRHWSFHIRRLLLTARENSRQSLFDMEGVTKPGRSCARGDMSHSHRTVWEGRTGMQTASMLPGLPLGNASFAVWPGVSFLP